MEPVDTKESLLEWDTIESRLEVVRFIGTGGSCCVSACTAGVPEVPGPTRKPRRDLPRSWTGLISLERPEPAGGAGVGTGAIVAGCSAVAGTGRSVTGSLGLATTPPVTVWLSPAPGVKISS